MKLARTIYETIRTCDLLAKVNAISIGFLLKSTHTPRYLWSIHLLYKCDIIFHNESYIHHNPSVKFTTLSKYTKHSVDSLITYYSIQPLKSYNLDTWSLFTHHKRLQNSKIGHKNQNETISIDVLYSFIWNKIHQDTRNNSWKLKINQNYDYDFFFLNT